MYFKLGTYQHPAGEALVRFNIEPVYDTRGGLQMLRKRFAVSGELIAEGQAAIKTAIAGIEAAYLSGRTNQDAGLYHDNGTVSAHFLKASTSMGGVRITKFDYPNGEGAEYATYRTYEIELEAEYESRGGGYDGLVSWSESLSITGTGGPRRVVLTTALGPPVTQVVAQRTPIRARQTGSAVGFRAYPTPPPPLWPNVELVEEREISRTTPTKQNGAIVNYGISWSYSFISATPLTGTPTAR
jgi:hypothetical protein